jgi:cbb3-type cytochrome oxidase maturation protein
MMVYLFFVIYIVTGFIISLCILFWALKNGQFRDQQRARFLPLVEEQEKPGTKQL